MGRRVLQPAARRGHLGEAEQQRRALLTAGGLGVAPRSTGAGERAPELGIEVLPGARRLVDFEQRGEGDAIVGGLVERALVGEPGRGGVAQVAPLDDADGVEQLQAPRRARGLVERGAVEREALPRAALLAQEGVDAGEQLGGRGLVRERAPEDRQRAGDVAARHQRLAGAAREEGERGVVDGAVAEGVAQGGGAAGDVAAGREPIDALDPRGRLLEGGDERLREAARREVGGAPRVAQGLVGELRRLGEGGEAEARVFAERGARLEHAHQQGGVALGAGQRLEHVGGGGAQLARGEQPVDAGSALLLRRIGGERLPVRFERAARVVEARLPELAEPRVDGRLLRRRGERRLLREGGRELLPAPLLFEQRCEPRQHLARGAVRGDVRLPRRERRGPVGQPGRPQLRRAKRQLAGARRVALGGDQAVEHPGELGPGAHRLVEAAQRARRVRLQPRPQEALVGGDGRGEVGEIDLGDAAQLGDGGEARVLLGLDLGEPGQRGGEPPRIARLGAEGREGARRAQAGLVVGAGVEDRLVRGPRLLPVAQLAEEIAEVGADARPHRRIARGRRRPRERLGRLELLVERRRELDEARADVVVGGVERDHGLVDGERLLQVAELLQRQPRELLLRLQPLGAAQRLDLHADQARRLGRLARGLERDGERGRHARGERLVREQLLGDAAGVLVGGIGAEDLLDVGERALDLAEAARVQPEEPRADRQRLLRRLGRLLGEGLLQQLGEIGEPARLLVELGERLLGVVVGRGRGAGSPG